MSGDQALQSQEAPAFDPIPILATELTLPPRAVAATVELLTAGSTVPFIARYRKEATLGLDEVQIRAIEERHAYLLDLEKRRQSILVSIAEQGKLTDELRTKILATTSKTDLEDLYLPYKPKRRTRAIIAREKGLQPLADRILAQPAAGDPASEAAAFVSEEKAVASAEDALAGARDIVAETMAENAEIRALTRESYLNDGQVVTEVVPEKAEQQTKFKDYYDFSEAVAKIPSHRYLAVRRGENEEVLRVRLEVDSDRLQARILTKLGYQLNSPFAPSMLLAVQDGIKRLLSPSIETEVRVELKLRADKDAVDVFASNLRNLLLASPLGTKSVVGIDPGIRTGCKCVAVDATGKFIDPPITIYPSQGEAGLERAKRDLKAFVAKHGPVAVAVGNGTAGRETEALARQIVADQASPAIVVSVSEAGASVYSASEVAREEFPELDVTIRGAISIARRLQDPLAELVKIDPKAIGVGQYQHDVHQPLLARKLEEVVESCVNHVGVELNTASAPLLAHVAGIGPKLAKKIVEHRDQHGSFSSRQQLLQVSGLGPRTFEQAAGFLRVRGGEHPLDSSAVHPERYELVERIAGDMQVALQQLVGNAALAGNIDIARYTGDGVGEPTLRDIISELQKPGRDPRATFEPPRFRDDVMTLEDLQPGMELEGVVTNVTAFGAFVDVGVHQDGLVHISQLSDRFVKDPHEVVRAGDKLKVKVLEVDRERKRISLTAKSGQPAKPEARSQADSRPAQQRPDQRKPQGKPDPRTQQRPDNRGQQRPDQKPGQRPDQRPGQRQDQRPDQRPGQRQDQRSDQRPQQRPDNRGQRPEPPKKDTGGGLSYNPFADLLKR